MTELSIGELDSLVFKAYRGAGFSWGLSQEAGRAAAWMAIRGLPAARCFAELLQQTDGVEHSQLTPELVDGDWSNTNDPDSPTSCPVITGTMLSDFGWSYGGELILYSVYSPLIILPFVSNCAKSAGVALGVKGGGSSITLMADGHLASGLSDRDFETADKITISESKNVAARANPVAPIVRRAAVSDVELARLEALAHRTYVPASEQSRGGAGAGLTDND